MMNSLGIFKLSIQQIAATQTIGWVIAIWLMALPSHAAQSNFQFNVKVQLVGGIAFDTGLCRSSSRIGLFGEAVTVVCATGAEVNFSGDKTNHPWTAAQDGNYRIVTLGSKAGESLGTVDSYAGGGTVTSWRIVNLADQDYLELMVGW